MTGKDLVKLLQQNDWVIDRIRGSHYVMKKEKRTLTVPVHSNKDIPIGTLNAILKQAGLK